MTKGWAGDYIEKAQGWGGATTGLQHVYSASFWRECVGMLCGLGTDTSSQDGSELGTDSGVEKGDRFEQQRPDKRFPSPNPS